MGGKFRVVFRGGGKTAKELCLMMKRRYFFGKRFVILNENYFHDYTF